MRMAHKSVQSLSPAGPRVVAEGLGFPEVPRWHGNALWFVDIADGVVHRLSADGKLETVVSVPGRPAGFGFMPDGSPLINSMHGRVVYRWDGKSLMLHADLRALVTGDLNEMVVAPDGTAFVGNLGYDPDSEPVLRVGLVRVRPDGAAEMLLGQILRPNGSAISPDRKYLFVAETRVGQVLRFDLDEAGNLSNQQTFGTLEQGTWSDGLCLDSEGGLWVADPIGKRMVRLNSEGIMIGQINFGELCPLGCMLGGEDRRTLFITTGPLGMPFPEAAKARLGKVLALQVDVAGAGWP